MKILATYNIKGGVGKTAAAVNLAHRAATEGHRVLVWDLDPQGAATFYFRVKPKVKGGGEALVQGRRELDRAIKGTDFANLDLVPADFSYRNLDLLLDDAKKPLGRLGKLLAPMKSDYDFVVLDCPPSISLASEAVFRASDALVVPVIPTTLSARTFDQLEAFVDDHPEVVKKLKVFGFFSMVDAPKEAPSRAARRAPRPPPRPAGDPDPLGHRRRADGRAPGARGLLRPHQPHRQGLRGALGRDHRPSLSSCPTVGSPRAPRGRCTWGTCGPPCWRGSSPATVAVASCCASRTSTPSAPASSTSDRRSTISMRSASPTTGRCCGSRSAGGATKRCWRNWSPKGRTYPCYCTRREVRAEIEAAASAPQGSISTEAYPGTCGRLDTRGRAAREAEGRRAALRVRSEAEDVTFHDRLAGVCRGVVDDFVIRRSDGTPAYNLAVVVDDHDQSIDEVVRGDDLLTTTPRQILLGRWLGWASPSYAHVPLVMGPDGERLAKRHGSVTLADQAASGYDAIVVRSWLATSLGLAEPGEPVSLEVMLERFDPVRLPRQPWVLPAGIVAGSVGDSDPVGDTDPVDPASSP